MSAGSRRQALLFLKKVRMAERAVPSTTLIRAGPRRRARKHHFDQGAGMGAGLDVELGALCGRC
jgi:hypothetical protein